MSFIFIISGLNKIFDWQSMEESFVSVICEWQSSVEGVGFTGKFTEILLPYVPVLLGISVCFELVGGVFVLLGVKVNLGALLLLIFLLPVTIIEHPFWLYQGALHDIKLGLFLKNLSICGGLLTLIAYTSLKKEVA
ncbi:MAG: DoxX family protein [Simkaniaceae bacterium]|nr:DoxX family protein [Simkaniaceae bacterium]